MSLGADAQVLWPPIHVGCGHDSSPILLNDDSTFGIIAYFEWEENNPEDLCFWCWSKKHGLLPQEE